jgi:hypothetical protein
VTEGASMARLCDVGEAAVEAQRIVFSRQILR